MRRWWGSVRDDERSRATTSLSSYLSGERARILEGADEERAAQFRAAEQRRAVFQAWNDVCAGTREGAHVTGLHYVAESNELVVYLDSAAWAQEMAMLREIVRARMAVKGVKVDAIVCRASKPSYVHAASTQGAARPSSQQGSRPAPRSEEVEVPPEVRARIEEDVAPIEDQRLKKALEGAMFAAYRNDESKNN